MVASATTQNRASGEMKADDESISSVSGAASSRLHLLNLPAEIQEMIFDYSYPANGKLKIINRHRWDRQERKQRRSLGKTYQPRPFTSHLVSRFLVCKQFFLGAAKAFIGNQIIESPGHYFDADDPTVNYNIIYRFLKTAVSDLDSVKSLFERRSIGQPLRKLTIRYDDGSLDMRDVKYAWEEESTEDDFRSIANIFALKHLANVKDFDFEFRPFGVRVRGVNRETWNKNPENFESFVRAYVAEANLPKTEVDSGTDELLPTNSTSSAEDSMSLPDDLHETNSLSNLESTVKLTINELPRTAEEMIELLKNEGERVMDLISDLQSREC